MCKINNANCSHERSEFWDAKIAGGKRIKHLKIYFDRRTIRWYENAMLGVNTCNFFFSEDFSAMLREPENKILVERAQNCKRIEGVFRSNIWS